MVYDVGFYIFASAKYMRYTNITIETSLEPFKLSHVNILKVILPTNTKIL